MNIDVNQADPTNIEPAATQQSMEATSKPRKIEKIRLKDGRIATSYFDGLLIVIERGE